MLIPPAPGVTKKFVRAKHLRKKGEDDEAIHYFDLHLPRLKEAEHRPGGKLPEMIECIQYPGETMFVPGGWWHAVLNLDATIAITENVCNEGNFSGCVREPNRQPTTDVAKEKVDAEDRDDGTALISNGSGGRQS